MNKGEAFVVFDINLRNRAKARESLHQLFFAALLGQATHEDLVLYNLTRLRVGKLLYIDLRSMVLKLIRPLILSVLVVYLRCYSALLLSLLPRIQDPLFAIHVLAINCVRCGISHDLFYGVW